MSLSKVLTAQFTAVDYKEAHSVLSHYRFAQIRNNTCETPYFQAIQN